MDVDESRRNDQPAHVQDLCAGDAQVPADRANAVVCDRDVELTSYGEIVLAPAEADEALAALDVVGAPLVLMLVSLAARPMTSA